MASRAKRIVCRLAGAAARLARRGHRDQHGAMSILSVLTVLALTMLLGMVMNVGREVDGKIRMQNAADAAAYSGGLVLARGLNSLAFTNHLLCEVFAMTAFMRVAHDRNAERYVPDILAAWEKEAPVLSRSTFPKFAALGPAIAQKVPREQELVRSFCDWAAAIAGGTAEDPGAGALPLMETVLREHLITDYQRAVLAAIPEMAQHAAMNAAGQDGEPEFRRGPMSGVLWQLSTARPVDASYLSSIVGDPNRGGADPAAGPSARTQRDALALQYLGLWNNQVLAFFDYGAKMSQFAQLWRGFTCGEVQKLFEQYSDSNLPMLLRTELQPGGTLDSYEAHLDTNFTFLAVAYWKKVPQLLPGLYRSPVASDDLTYAEVRVFVPTARLVWRSVVPQVDQVPTGGPPGSWGPDQPSQAPTGWTPGRQPGVATTWDLFNQHWTCQLVPAAHPNVVTVLQTPPPAAVPGRYPPNLAGTSPQDLEQINYH